MREFEDELLIAFTEIIRELDAEYLTFFMKKMEAEANTK